MARAGNKPAAHALHLSLVSAFFMTATLAGGEMEFQCGFLYLGFPSGYGYWTSFTYLLSDFVSHLLRVICLFHLPIS